MAEKTETMNSDIEPVALAMAEKTETMAKKSEPMAVKPKPDLNEPALLIEKPELMTEKSNQLVEKPEKPVKSIEPTIEMSKPASDPVDEKPHSEKHELEKTTIDVEVAGFTNVTNLTHSHYYVTSM